MKNEPVLLRFVFAAFAALLIYSAADKPLWIMDMEAPQYPKGLQIQAFGERVTGDLREINIINHYIGMAELTEQPAPEMALFGWSITGLVVLILIAPLHRYLYLAAIAATAALPLGILSDMQYWLHRYGHDLSSDAPFRQDPFTPKILGSSMIGQFQTHARIDTGIWLMIAATAVLVAGWFISRRAVGQRSESSAGRVALAMLCIGMTAPLVLQASPGTIQQRIDAAAAGSTVMIDGGAHAGPVRITKPLTLIGRNSPVIDGRGAGSVVIIDADDVTFTGFTVQNSGRNTVEEAAGIEVRGSHHRIENNIVRDVQFGIHAMEGASNQITGNTIVTGRGRGYRGGDAINVWYVRDSVIRGNTISMARDGIYLSFTDGVRVEGNVVTDSRYGVHSMFSENIRVERNRLERNLLGAALMNSNRLVFSGNLVLDNRQGSTAYGVLLKDIGDLDLQGNHLLRNRVGIYADNAPDSSSRSAVIRKNLFLGNETGMALQSNVHLKVAENSFIDNLTDVRSEGGNLQRNSWSIGGRGNFWSSHRTHDGDGDGVSDLPFQPESAMSALIQKNASTRAFLYTPAHQILELAVRLFPIFRAEPLLVDESPLMAPAHAVLRRTR